MPIFNNVLAGAAGSAGGAAGFQIDRSLRFNSGDTAHLNKTFSSAGNRKTFTFSCWVKRSGLTAENNIFHAGNASWFRFESTDQIYIWHNGSTSVYTDAKFRDVSAWYHLVLSVDTTQSTASNRIKLYVNGTQQTLSGTQPSQNADLAWNNNVAHYIGRQQHNTSNMLNGYLAEVNFVDGTQLAATDFGEFDDNGVWQPKEYSGQYNEPIDQSQNWTNLVTFNAGTWNGNGTNPFNADPTDYDYGDTTRENNGYATLDLSSFSGAKVISVTAEQTELTLTHDGGTTVYTPPNTSRTTHTFASVNNPTSLKFDGLNANSVFVLVGVSVDGKRLVNSNITVANNGFHLDFSDNSSNAALGTDSSGNSNTWTVNNLSVASGAGNDSLIDTPTNYEAGSGNNGGNYATLNPVDKGGDSSATVTDGNLKWFGGTTINHAISRSTIGVSSGKWYVEVTIEDASDTSGRDRVGVVSSEENVSITNPVIGNFSTGYGYRSDGFKENNGSSSSYGASYTTGDTIGIALDMDTGSLVFYKNGSSQGTAYTSIGGTMHFCGTPRENGTYVFNFGQRPFAYTPPTGYKALCTTNLPDPTIADGSTAFDTKLYTGNGTTQTISGLNFSPDLVWAKKRNGTTYHNLVDIVRGANKELYSNDTLAETTPATAGLTAFNNDGFDLGANSGWNNNNDTYVAWTWDGGTSTVSNTDGSVTTSVRANQSAGFSIVTFNSGSSDGDFTCGHGLNAAPELILMKSRSRNGGPWWVFHRSVTDATTKYLQLSTTGALITNSGGNIWGSSLPASSVFGFSVGAGKAHTQSETVVSYCFAPVEGYSAFGSYEGGSAPFVFTGFRPRWVMIKNADLAGEEWTIFDTARDTYNVAGLVLYPNTSGAEFDGSSGVNARNIDVLSNGFKVNTGNPINQTGTHVYAAFAEHPFKTARAR